jgi:hypothetical protein
MFLSPILAAVLAALVVAIAKYAHLSKSSYASLLISSLIFAAIGVAISLIVTIIWMIWYESSTGYSAGNAPLGWIFFYGPVSAAIGQLLALVKWWFTKAANSSA